MNIEYIGPGPKYDGYGQSTSMIQEFLQKRGILCADSGKIALIYGKPLEIYRTKAPKKVLILMFESTRMPEEWGQAMKLADVVITPSHYCKNVIKAQFDIDATVIPLGYDDRYFTPRDRTSDEVTFIHYDSFTIRKGFFPLMKAWEMAFSEKDNVKLILKTVQDRLVPIHGYHNVEIIQKKLRKDLLAELLASADCLVFPSMGEGFGHNPLEMMAVGGHVIAPNQHGIAEYFNYPLMHDIKTRDVPARYDKYRGRDMGSYVECDVDDLAEKMNWVYNNIEHIRKGRVRRQEYAQRFTHSKFADQLANILNVLHGTNNYTLPS